MLLIPCPWCGARAELEFQYAGEGGINRPKEPRALSDAEWADYVYYRTNPKGVHHELWYHVNGCGRYFNLWRDTVSYKVLGAASMGAPPPSFAERKEV